MSTPEEKRQDQRFCLVLQVQYPGQEGFIDDSTENLSAGGAFVRTERPLAVGDRIPLNLTFPGLLDPLALIGVVTWVRPKREDEPAGVGIQIPEDRPQDRSKLRDLMNRANPSSVTAPATGAPSSSAAPESPSTYRVLIVEDNPHLSEMYEYVIRKIEQRDEAKDVSLEVTVATDGHQAWQKLCAQPFDLVLTDIFMPVMDGFTLVAKIRSDDRMKSVPVVAISAGDEQVAARTKQCGATTYLRKPVRFVDVLTTVRALLNLRRSSR